MPLYDYQCPQHGAITEMRSIAAREAPASCPSCGALSSRVVSAPRLALMSAANRTAWARNERSAHEPRQTVRSACGHVHRAGESCGGGRREGTKVQLNAGNPGSRPWMLGH